MIESGLWGEEGEQERMMGGKMKDKYNILSHMQTTDFNMSHMTNKYHCWGNIQRKENQHDMSKRHLNAHIYI